jgi:tetratricopeptide (TPR) repeat protein
MRQFDLARADFQSAASAPGGADKAVVRHARADATNRLARLLASRRAEPADLERAIELMEAAAAADPNYGDFQTTLGLARYRRGDFAGALVALQKSTMLRSGGDGHDWILLAMTRWRLGDIAEAHLWYDRAVEWKRDAQPRDEELLDQYAEATSLLGK